MTQVERHKKLSSDLCKRFFDNIDYLRRKRGLTLSGLSRAMSTDEFRVSRGAVNCYRGRRGVGSSKGYFKASTIYLAAYADFFGEDLGRLLTEDYTARDSGS